MGGGGLWASDGWGLVDCFLFGSNRPVAGGEPSFGACLVLWRPGNVSIYLRPNLHIVVARAPAGRVGVGPQTGSIL